jgi:prepilin peptidase CpaA
MAMFHLTDGLYAALVVLLVTACVTDWRARIIPHGVNISIAVLGVASWWAHGWHFWPAGAAQIALSLGLFIIFAMFQLMGAMGGGDVKLIGALALWFPWPLMTGLLVIMSITGGVLTVAMLVHAKLSKQPDKPEIPYGIAIALGGLFIICEHYLNHFG